MELFSSCWWLSLLCAYVSLSQDIKGKKTSIRDNFEFHETVVKQSIHSGGSSESNFVFLRCVGCSKLFLKSENLNFTWDRMGFFPCLDMRKQSTTLLFFTHVSITDGGYVHCRRRRSASVSSSVRTQQTSSQRATRSSNAYSRNMNISVIGRCSTLY